MLFPRLMILLATLVAVPFFASSAFASATCEEIFAGSASNTLLSPKTVAGRVRKNMLVRGLLSKQSSTARAARSTSISSSGGGISVLPMESQRPRAVVEAKTETAIPPKTYALPEGVSRTGAIRWLSDTNFILLNHRDGKHMPRSGWDARLVDAEFVDGITGNVLSGQVSFLRIEDEAPILRFVKKGTGADTYRFLDAKTLMDVRKPIVSWHPPVMVGNFISYEDIWGQSFLTSLSPKDFGPHETNAVNRPLSKTFSKLNAVLDGEGNRVRLLGSPNRVEAFVYDPVHSAYRMASLLTTAQDFKTAQGDVYSLTAGLPNLLFLKKSDAKHAQQIELPPGVYISVLHVFGDGPNLGMLLQDISAHGYPFVQILNIGQKSVTLAGTDLRFLRWEIQGERFVALRQDTQRGPPAVIDLVSGRVEILTGFKNDQEVTVLDAKHFVEIDKFIIGAYPLETGGASKVRGVVRIYDFATRTIQKQIEKVGAKLSIVPRTRILRVEDNEKITFTDLDTDETLWSGGLELLPRVSPDGSRIAYLVENTLHVAVLGAKLESRRTY